MFGLTENATPLLASPPTVTTTLPVVAPAGTGTVIEVLDQLVGVAVTPLNVTVLVPCVAPKALPVIVIEPPMTPEVAERLVIPGVTVKLIELLATPRTVATIGPEEAAAGTGTTIVVLFQLVGVPLTPLNEMVLLPCVKPKLVPEIVMEPPAGPEFDERPVIAAGVYRSVAASRVTLPTGSLLMLVYLIRSDCPGPAALNVTV